MEAPIPLSREMLEAIRTWAADDRLWTTQETVAFNLCTFARVILKQHIEDSKPKAIDHFWTPDPTKRFCMKCGDNDLGSVWGAHRFQIQPGDPDFVEGK